MSNYKTAYMSRADVIVLLTANVASNMLDAHGGAAGTPKRIVDFATKLADELVKQGVVDGPEADDEGDGLRDSRTTDAEDLAPESVPEPEIMPETEPAPENHPGA